MTSVDTINCKTFHVRKYYPIVLSGLPNASTTIHVQALRQERSNVPGRNVQGHEVPVRTSLDISVDC